MPIGTSWGRWPRHRQRVVRLKTRWDPLPEAYPVLPFGNGRSYGDVCLNADGTLLATRGLDRFIRLDTQSGTLECETGVLLSDIIALTLPHGWFPPVTPGTALVTVGGAIANDVHGKNHHRAGSFGHHLLGFELRRSTGQTLYCSPEQNEDWFGATLGGLGLTGLIATARIRLKRIPGAWVEGDSQRFGRLPEFFGLVAESDPTHEYTVAWLDCAAGGRRLGRGVFLRANHVEIDRPPPKARLRRFPFTPPISPVTPLSVRLFNAWYFHRSVSQQRHALWHYASFLYPLDSLLEWNRLYGPRGFFQYQCVLGTDSAPDALSDMLQLIARSGQGSFLAVLKKFGEFRSLGWLSFPRPGLTLALDFPNRGESTLRLLASLDSITLAAGGAVYPAKDARMSARSFQTYFPAWTRLQPYIDPKFSSSFWRRVSRLPP